MKIKTTIIYENEPLVSQRAMRRAIKVGANAAGLAWRNQKRMLASHFKKVAFRKYGHVIRPRSRKYMKTKAKQRHPEPLVLTGRTKELALNSDPNVRAGLKRITVTLPATDYAKMRRKHSGFSIADEMTVIAPKEVTWLETIFLRELERELEKEKSKKTKRLV